MLIGFIGDVHGLVYHTIAALVTWQEHMGRPFDLFIQVKDMGAYPEPARMDMATLQYLEVNPAQADFSRLLHASGQQADDLRPIRGQFSGPVYFIRGNHEDCPWLLGLPISVTFSHRPVGDRRQRNYTQAAWQRRTLLPAASNH